MFYNKKIGICLDSLSVVWLTGRCREVSREIKETTTTPVTGTSPDKKCNRKTIAVHVRYKSLYILCRPLQGPFTQVIFVAATRCNFCRAKVATSCNFFSAICRRDIAGVSNMFETLARQKLHRVAPTQIACVNETSLNNNVKWPSSASSTERGRRRIVFRVFIWNWTLSLHIWPACILRAIGEQTDLDNHEYKFIFY